MQEIILITRPQPEASETAKQWQNMGFNCIISPVIIRNPVEGYLANLSHWERSARLQAEAGKGCSPLPLGKGLGVRADKVLVRPYITTSAYGVELLHKYPPALTAHLYVTGAKLANKAQDLGFAHIHYAGGSAGSLMQYLNQYADKNADYLALHSNHQAVDMVGELSKLGFNVHGLEIYQTNPAKTLTKQTIAAIINQQIAKVLLYSAMSANSFITLCEQYGLLQYLSYMQAICISEDIAKIIPNNLFQEIIIKPLYE